MKRISAFEIEPEIVRCGTTTCSSEMTEWIVNKQNFWKD